MRRTLAGLTALLVTVASTGWADLCFCHEAAEPAAAAAGAASSCCHAAEAVAVVVPAGAPALATDHPCERGCCTPRVRQPQPPPEDRSAQVAPERSLLPSPAAVVVVAALPVARPGVDVPRAAHGPAPPGPAAHRAWLQSWTC